ncbi:Eco57I restriction endonuclease [Bacillus cereus Rock3-44]|nr:Eco57I restriction endonuclease [Bacillus cereus Rock3-44]
MKIRFYVRWRVILKKHMKNQNLVFNEKQLKQLIAVLNNDLEVNYQEFEDSFNQYYSKVKELSGDLVKVDKEIALKNYSLEVVLFCLLCSIFKRYLEVIFNIKLDYKYIANRYDTNGFYAWFEMKNRNVELIDNYIIQEGELGSELISSIYEKSLNAEEKKRLGQFYTPNNIVNLMIDETNLRKIDFNNTKSIIDPACGAGIFLVNIIKMMKKRNQGLSLAKIIYNSLHGNDINPFAIFLTKLNMSCELLNTMKVPEEVMEFLDKYADFKNIVLVNTITEDNDEKYDYIIGNPPYFKLSDKKFKNHEMYTEIMYGQPNIYGLFIYWSLKHSKENGYISLIVPQSFKSGLYFLNLRNELSKYRIKSLINFKSRTKIFKNVLQAVIIMTIKNQKKGKAKVKVSNVEENNLKNIEFLRVDQNRIVQNSDYNFFFFIPKDNISLSILEKVYDNSFNLKSKNSNIMFGNGLFVWNQNKSILTNDFNGGTAPVIYGNFINSYDFNYNSIVSSNVEKKRMFSYYFEKSKTVDIWKEAISTEDIELCLLSKNKILYN